MESSLVFGVEKKKKTLEFVLTTVSDICVDLNVNSPILTFGAGKFFFFDDYKNFESYAKKISSKPFHDAFYNKLKRDVIGNYCCDFEVLDDNVLSLDLNSGNQLNYGCLSSIIVGRLDNSKNSKIKFAKFDNFYLSK